MDNMFRVRKKGWRMISSRIALLDSLLLLADCEVAYFVC